VSNTTLLEIQVFYIIRREGDFNWEISRLNGKTPLNMRSNPVSFR
jgi:hypothetical protein